MGKQMVEVEIPDGWELAEPAMRVPSYGDKWLDLHGIVRHESDTVRRVIVRPAWQWPSWLKAPWIAMDEGDPVWRAFDSEPSRHGHSGCWHRAEGYSLYPDIFDFTPPPCTDWRQSKRKNPNL